MANIDRLAVLRTGLTHLRDGRFAAAVETVEPLIAAAPDDTEALLVRGLSSGVLGDVGIAVKDLVRLGELRPDAAHPLLDLVTILRPLDNIAAAGPVLTAALEHAPNDRRLIFTAAQIWLDLGQSEAALALLDRVVWGRGDPIMPRPLVLRGIARCEASDFTAAIADFRAALEIAPDDVWALSNLGVVLATVGEFAESIARLDRACRLAPGDVRLHLNRAVALLKSGDWTNGFPAFEAARVRMPGRDTIQPRPFLHSFTLPPPPVLEPGEPVAGRTLLLTHDEGFGDTIQYLRFAPLLAAQGARVLVLVPKELGRLAARVAGVAEVLTDLNRLPPFDARVPFPRLPMLFGVTPDALPGATYLDADPALVAAWAERLPPRPPGARRRIGLVWAGKARVSEASALAVDRHRSLKLAALAPFAELPDTQLVSLQVGPPADEPRPPGLVLHDPMREVADFADTAAIIANLDAVVSADTAVVHLAGAMGKPVLMLDRFDHCWRWASGEAVAGGAGKGKPARAVKEPLTTRWYESLLIFRQDLPGDWAAPVRRALESLRL